MTWFIVLTYVVAGQPHDMAFGPYASRESCELAALVAPYEPRLQEIVPEIVIATSEHYDCVVIDDPEAILERE